MRMAETINTAIYKHADEPYDDYFVRLFEHKKEYGLNCVQIAELLNDVTGEDKGESAYRKEYAAFNRGRIYEACKGESQIATRILSISDLHCPFQLPVETYIDYIDRVDILQLNGDIGDCQAISKFSKTYRISPMEELIQTRQYIIDLVNYIHPKKVVANYGNHDIRFQKYLSNNLDTDILELMPQTSLELIFEDGFHHYNKREKTKVWYSPLKECFDNIEMVYNDKWYSQIGDVIFCHPLTYSSQPMITTDKARRYFKDEGFLFTTIVMAHTHRVGSYPIGDTMMYEQGAACDVTQMRYHDGNFARTQKEGFIYLCLDSSGKEIEAKTKLVRLN